MRRLQGILFVVSFLTASVGWSWGSLGHRATGHIAEAALTPQARQAVRALLRGATLADVSTWADAIKSDPTYGHVSWYHFEKMDDGSRYLNHIQALPADLKAKGGLLQALLVSERTLESRTETWGEKDAALRFLVHFIGDLHQPMHSGRPEDKGGLRVPVKWGERDSNLHSVWDSGLILTAHAALFADQPVNADWSVIYARHLMQTLSRRATLPPATRHNPESWLNESMTFRNAAYNREHTTNPAAYERAQIQVVDWRVYSAGLRIADTINRIFAGQPTPPVQVELVRRLESLVGRLEQLIVLGPREPQPVNPEQLFH